MGRGTVIDEDEVIPKDETPKLITELQDVDKCVPTIFDYARIKAILNDALSISSRMQKIPRPLVFFGLQRNPNEPPSYLYNKDLFFLKYENTEEKKYILLLHKIHAERFLEVDLEEKMNRITEVVRITTDQPHGLDFMEQILVMRENDKPDSFSKADFKYLNKNDIEDLYYLCRNKNVNLMKLEFMNSLDNVH
ncbi:hypothetical protein Tco_0015236 [Tanacetum coccineum]